MTYDFELYFTGLCLFALDAHADNRPNVLVVNATRYIDYFKDLPRTEAPRLHRPVLVVSPRNIRPDQGLRQPEEVSLHSTGEDSALFDMALEEAEVQLPAGPDLVVPRGRKSSHKVFENPSESGADPEWFDWTISVPDVAKTPEGSAVKSLLPECMPPYPLTRTGPVISRLTLSKGRLETFEVAQGPDGYRLHRFRSISNKDSDETPHCIADRVVLRGEDLPGEEDVRIRTSSGEIRLGPSDLESGKQVVRAAVVNLPTRYHPMRPAQYDFLWFYTLYAWSSVRPPAEDLPVPRGVPYPEGLLTPSTGTCPPGSG